MSYVQSKITNLGTTLNDQNLRKPRTSVSIHDVTEESPRNLLFRDNTSRTPTVRYDNPFTLFKRNKEFLTYGDQGTLPRSSLSLHKKEKV